MTVDVFLGIIKKGDEVWGHNGQLSRRKLVKFIEPKDDGYLCELNGEKQVFRYVRYRKKR